MKSPAITTHDTVRQAVEAVRRDAGPQELDQMTALTWLLKLAEHEVAKLKQKVRSAAFHKLSGDEANVPMPGRLGTAQVTFMLPTVKLRKDAPVDQLKKILGGRFTELFKVIPERIEPVNGFKKKLDDFVAPKPIIDLVESAVSYSDRSARVQPPGAPKV